MKPNSKVNLTASLAGENSQTKGTELTIVSSILTDLRLIFKRNNGRKAASSDRPMNQQKSRVQATSFKIMILN
jgi:hypothetical protein